MKKQLVTAVAVLSILFSANAHAGIPTVNIPDLVVQVVSWLGNYLQGAEQIASGIEQVEQYAKQIQQFDQQINQYKQQYDALTGSRGLGDILNNMLLRDVVPQDVTTVYNQINSGGMSGLTSAAKTIRAKYQIYNCEGRTGDDAARCQANMNKGAQDMAYSENALKLTSQRQEQIQSLQNQINSATDPKAIADLQARIQTEQAQVQNDQVRMNALAIESENHNRLIQQQLKERTLKNLSEPADTSFSFTLP